MKKYKLSDFVEFIPGINSTRARKKYGDNIDYYDQEAFEQDQKYAVKCVEESDLHSSNDELALQVGDVVISSSVQLATLVGTTNAGKVPSLNFIKVNFNGDALDKCYFIYLFNASQEIKRQKERELQGNVSLRIPLKALKQLEIPVVSLEKQRKIGEAYIKVLQLQTVLNTYGELIEEFTNRILRESLEGKNSEE